MTDKPANWLPPVDPAQLELPLPPRPGIKRFCDACPKCRVAHTDAASAQACRSMVAQREQL